MGLDPARLLELKAVARKAITDPTNRGSDTQFVIVFPLAVVLELLAEIESLQQQIIVRQPPTG